MSKELEQLRAALGDRKIFGRKFSTDFFFERRKIKCWNSSETRFPKFSGRTEPSSGGKRPFKVCTFFRFGFSAFFQPPSVVLSWNFDSRRISTSRTFRKNFGRGRRWRKLERLRKTSENFWKNLAIEGSVEWRSHLNPPHPAKDGRRVRLFQSPG